MQIRILQQSLYNFIKLFKSNPYLAINGIVLPSSHNLIKFLATSSSTWVLSANNSESSQTGLISSIEIFKLTSGVSIVQAFFLGGVIFGDLDGAFLTAVDFFCTRALGFGDAFCFFGGLTSSGISLALGSASFRFYNRNWLHSKLLYKNFAFLFNTSSWDIADMFKSILLNL